MINIKIAIQAPLAFAKVDSMVTEKGQTIEFCRCAVIDADAFMDNDRIFNFTLKVEAAKALGLDREDVVKSLVGKDLVFEGVYTSQYDKRLEKSVMKFKADSVKQVTKSAS